MFKKIYASGILLIILISAGYIIQYSYMNNIIIEEKEQNVKKSREILGQTINSELKLYSEVIESASHLISTNHWSKEEISYNIKEIFKENSQFNLIFYGDVNNELIDAIDWQPPDDFDLRTRPWYKKSVEVGDLTYSGTYIDALTGGLTITISKPIYDTNKELLGVIGGDVSINQAIKIVEDSSKKANEIGYSFLIDGEGNILAHPNYMYDQGTELDQLAKISYILLDEMKENQYGETRVSLNNADGFLSYQPIENTDWSLGSFATLKEYKQSDAYVYRILIIGLILGALTTGVFFILQNRYFIRPLRSLVTDIENITVNKNISHRIPTIHKDPFSRARQSINMILKEAELIFRQQEEYHEELYHLSYYDHLTDVYNRRFFEKKIQTLDIKSNLPLGLIMADVNGLKLINDSFGHEVGDQMLKETGRVLKQECDGKYPVFRMGGDEFVIIMPKTKMEEVQDLIIRARKNSKKVSLNNIKLSLSFGAAIKTTEFESISDSLKEAEDNMHSNKLVEGPSMRSKTIDTIVQTLYEKNPREEAHSSRVSSICQQIGMELGMADEKIKQLETVGLLHDIGKIAISNEILEKKGALDEDEWKEIQRHPEIGYRILRTTSEMSEIAEYVLGHHERYDGKGYPRGLKGEEIPLVSRIIGIADTYDAMISDRPYRKGLPEHVAREEIMNHAGTQFDPELAKLFIEKVLGEVWVEGSYYN